jgi:hypothetical protein
MDEDASVVMDLTYLLFNIKVVGVLIFFSPFLKKYEKKTHNMFFLLLDLKFKSFYLLFALVGCE